MEVVKIERRPGGAKFEDIRELVSGQRGKLVYENGDPEYGIWTAGVSFPTFLLVGEYVDAESSHVTQVCIGLIHDVPTCEELVRRMEKEAEDVVNGLQRTVVKAKL